MKELKIIALTLPGMPDPSIAIAASRAGGIGLLDLEHVHSEAIALSSFHRLAKFAAHDFGIKLSPTDIGFIAKIVPELPQHFKLVVLTSGNAKKLKNAINDLHRRSLTVFVECTALAQAQKAENIGADGVIAKGHEAGGRVGNETTFILVQQFLDRLSLPVWAQGGIGLHTAAACHVAGAAGIVIDAQLALTRESVLSEDIKSKIARMDGTETLLLGEEVGEPYRVCSRLNLPVINTLKQKAHALLKARKSKSSTIADWNQTISRYVSSDFAEHQLFLFGQDIAFAASLADRFVTVGGILQAIRQAADSHRRAAHQHQPLAEGSPLAQSHGTRYPIVQGPMARVSDNAEFVFAVAQQHALPFVAAAWLRQPELDTLLKESKARLEGMPWGVGLLGFLPPEVYREQIKTILNYRPPFALIAGGQPSQAKMLEQEGIATYLHVPSPGLLRMFLDAGAQRFVFEGRESGGHIGPLCSFVLWEMMIETLLQYLKSGKRPEEYHVLFAGGIHDAMSAAMIAAMAATLAEKGVSVGIQLGSAYLFTEEAVTTGAIVRKYADEAIGCSITTVLESGPGHAVRCLNNAFAKAFHRKKSRLINEGSSSDEIHDLLQRMQLGRMRIASKGLAKNSKKDQRLSGPKTVPLNDDEQSKQGMYLIGQLAALKDRMSTIADLHQNIVRGCSERIQELRTEADEDLSFVDADARPADIAIIGMACLLPKASGLQQYWENILNKVSAIEEIPKERWDWRLYYDPDRNAKDKVYSKWGAFIDDICFDPTRYGMPPNTIPAIEPLQLLTLEVVRWALDDAGYSRRSFPREQTSVILGISGSGEVAQNYSFRATLPTFFGHSSSGIVSHFDQALPNWTEDSFAGILMNVTAGRVANRFDLGGTNFMVDGACASSLAAVYVAVKELEARTSDMVIVGGADCAQNPFTYMCFSKTQALSPRGCCNALDDNADGIVLGEGIAALILKRLADAERDGDRIYGVIKSVGSSSDGRDKSLTAPGHNGQARALRRAYAKAQVAPATVELIEAHATGTAVGDRVEIEALTEVFVEADAKARACAIGSVKSMIGHTKSTAGIASLIKATLGLHHKVLPPTVGVEKPNAALNLPESPFYANTDMRPWFRSTDKHPRRAGVSAFGFGGTNYHVVLEEYRQDHLKNMRKLPVQNWPSELFVWSKTSRSELLESLTVIYEALKDGALPPLSHLAATLARDYDHGRSGAGDSPVTLSIVASSLEELSRKLNIARDILSNSGTDISDPRGIYFSEQPLAAEGKVAFIFPGQGSQYINMLADLAVVFPEIRRCFQRSDQILKDRLSSALGSYVFPLPVFSEAQRHTQAKTLAQTHIAQPAMGTANLAMLHLLKTFGVEPDMVAGHSYGEYVALCAAGVFQENDLIALSEARARFMIEGAGPDSGAMAAVSASINQIDKMIQGIEGLWIANINAPNQTVITGTRSAIEKAIAGFTSQGLQSRRIPVSCAFHSPIVEPACGKLKDFLSNIELSVPRIKVFSNTTAKPYPDDPNAVGDQLTQHLISRVEFVREIEAMYADGARIFVEVGPGKVMTGLVDQILSERLHLAVFSNQSGRPGVVQLQHLLGQLAVQGVGVKLGSLFQHRSIPSTGLNALLALPKDEAISTTTWLVNGARAIPMREAAKSDPQQIKPVQLTVPNELNGASSQADRQHQGPGISSTGEQGTVGAASFPYVRHSENNSKHDPPPDSDDGKDQVMVRYQRLMQRFLEVQKTVMLNYLQGASEHVEGLSAGFGDRERQTTMPHPSSVEDLQKLSATEQHQLQPDESGSAQKPVLIPPDSEALEQSDDKAPLSAKPILDRKALTAKLLEIVGERTGYPQDMLELDVDLEADLGIDSIKRVEILGHFFKFAFETDQGAVPEDAIDLNQLKTLRKIIDHVETTRESSRMDQPEKISTPAEVHTTASATDFEEPGLLPRFTLSPMEVPPPNRSLQVARERLILMTDDGAGIAEGLKQKLMRRGYHVALIHFGETIEGKQNKYYSLKENFAETVSELVQTLRERHGPVGGIVHLLPLRPWPSVAEAEMSDWRERLQLDVRTLFYLLKLSENDLKQAAEEGGGIVMAATGMGGSFGSDPLLSDEAFFPGNGAIPGLLKTVAVEWPEIRVKSVDLNLKESNAKLVDHLLAETQADDVLVEVGYEGSRRLALSLTDAPLADSAEDVLQIDSSWVILITGGARGITAEIAHKLARGYCPTLILAGRSPQPSDKESDLTAALVEPQAIRSALINEMKSSGEPVKLAKVEEAYHRLCKDREIRANLTAMRQAGAQVIYSQVDVRDEQQFGGLIDTIYQTHGRLDGVIHGAGVIEDKLLTDKTWESFDRVFGTKTDSVFVLNKKLRPETLKFLVLFSSVAGRFGNAGQCDYTTANDVLNKIAVYLDNRWPGRVFSVNWGPWAGGGMASAEVQRQFNQRGVALISPSQGPESLDLELRKGHKGESEVVIGEGPWRKAVEHASGDTVSDSDLPLLQKNISIINDNGLIKVSRRLDPNQDLYLQDHRLDANPVLPAAMAIELIAESAQLGWPGWRVTTVSGVRVFKGIVLNNEPRDVRLILQAPTHHASPSKTAKLEVKITDPQQPETIFYRATVNLNKKLPLPQHYEIPTDGGMDPFWTSTEGAYEKWLFHGPKFQCIQRIQGISKRGMIATMRPSFPRECLAGEAPGEWLIDPIVIDGGLQLALLWARNYLDITILPSSFEEVHIFKPFHLSSMIHCHLEVIEEIGKQSVYSNIYYTDQAYTLLAMIKGFEATGSKGLNRLAGSHRSSILSEKIDADD